MEWMVSVLILPRKMSDIHYVQILPVYELLERVYTQGILHDLRTNFTVHVSGQVIDATG